MKAGISERAREAKAERKSKGGGKAKAGKTKTEKHTQKKGRVKGPKKIKVKLPRTHGRNALLQHEKA